MTTTAKEGDELFRGNRHEESDAGTGAGAVDDNMGESGVDDTSTSRAATTSSSSLDRNDSSSRSSVSICEHASIPAMNNGFTEAASTASTDTAVEEATTTTAAVGDAVPVGCAAHEASITTTPTMTSTNSTDSASTTMPARQHQQARRRRQELLVRAQASASRNKGLILGNNNNSSGGRARSDSPPCTSSDPISLINDDNRVPEQDDDDEKSFCLEVTQLSQQQNQQHEGKHDSSKSGRSSSRSPVMMIRSLTARPSAGMDDCHQVAKDDRDETKNDTKSHETAAVIASVVGVDAGPAASINHTTLVSATMESASPVHSIPNTDTNVGTLLPPPAKPPAAATKIKSRRVTYPVYPHFGGTSHHNSNSRPNLPLPSQSLSSARHLPLSGGAVVMHRTVPLLSSSPPSDQRQFVGMSSKNVNKNSIPLNVDPAAGNGKNESPDSNVPDEEEQKGQKQATMTRSHSPRLLPRHLNHRRRILNRSLSSSRPLQTASCYVAATRAATTASTDKRMPETLVSETTDKPMPETLVAETADKLMPETLAAETTTRVEMNQSEDSANISTSTQTETNVANLGDVHETAAVAVGTVQSGGDLLQAKSESEITDSVAITVRAAVVEAAQHNAGTDQEGKSVSAASISSSTSSTTSESAISQALKSYHETRLRKMCHQEDQACVQSMSAQYSDKCLRDQALEAKSFANACTPQGMVKECMHHINKASTLDLVSMEKVENGEDALTPPVDNKEQKMSIVTKQVTCETTNWAAAMTKDMIEDMSAAAAGGLFNTTHGMRHSEDFDKKRNKSASPLSEYTAATFATLTSASSCSSLSVDSELEGDDGEWVEIEDSLDDAAATGTGADGYHDMNETYMETADEDNKDTAPFVHQKGHAEKMEEEVSEGERHGEQSPIVNDSLEADGVVRSNAAEETEVSIKKKDEHLRFPDGGGDGKEPPSHAEPVATKECELVNTAGDHDGGEPGLKSNEFLVSVTQIGTDEPCQTTIEKQQVQAAMAEDTMGAANVDNGPLMGTSLTASDVAVSTSSDPDHEPQQEVKSSEINTLEMLSRKSEAEKVIVEPDSTQNIVLTPSMCIATEEYASNSANRTDEEPVQHVVSTIENTKKYHDDKKTQCSSSTPQQTATEESDDSKSPPSLQTNDEDSNLIKARKALIVDLLKHRKMMISVEQHQQDDPENCNEQQEHDDSESSNLDSTEQRQPAEEAQGRTYPSVLQRDGIDSSLMQARKALIKDLVSFHIGEKRTAEPPPRHVAQDGEKTNNFTETMTVVQDHNVFTNSISTKDTKDNRTAPLTSANEITATKETNQQTVQQLPESPTSASQSESRGGRTMEFKPISELIRRDLFSSDPAVVEWTLQLITVEAFADPDARSLIARLGGLLAITGAMETHASLYRVQVAACQALEKLALDDENEMAIVRVGGVDAVLAAFLGHADNVAVQAAAWGALSSMTGDFVETDIAIDAVGGFAALLRFMKRHDQNAIIQGNACRALASLCQGNETRLQALVAVDGIVAVAAALQAHWNDPETRREASNALSALCSAHRNESSI